jgi:siderophore synthetase component
VVAEVVEALLREDYAGLGGFVAGGRLVLPGGARVPLEPTPWGFPGEWKAAADHGLGVGGLVAALREVADPRDDLDGFERECGAEVTARQLQAVKRHLVMDRMRLEEAPLGPATYYDTLAAFERHPVYPTSRARPGLSEADLLRYAPEFRPTFELRWAAVPVSKAVRAGGLPGWWPSHADVGLVTDSSTVLFPVHPLTDHPGLAPLPYLHVSPTLSMRTVSVVADPSVHLKLPLPTSTLGLRNRRTIVPRTLADGAAVQRLLATLVDGERVLLADEQTYGHDDDRLAYLVRRFPGQAMRARVVPVAALLAESPGGGRVIEELTDDVESFFGAYLEALFALAVPLFTRHGTALETHQQNLSLVMDGSRIRLLVKDNDGPLLHPRLPGAADLADRRLVTEDAEALASVFVTITLHLCAAAVAFGLAERGLLPLPTGLGLVRDRLDEALTGTGRAGDFLRARTLDADRLPAKAMVTAGTLVDKTRTGAADINKHYGPPGPNYLRGMHR